MSIDWIPEKDRKALEALYDLKDAIGDSSGKDTNEELLFTKGMLVALSIHTSMILRALCDFTGNHPELITMLRNANKSLATRLPEKVSSGPYREGMAAFMEMTDQQLSLLEKN